MMSARKVSVYIATSVDGYIATENDSLDWLFRSEPEGDAGYAEFYETVDTIIMGRRTYDWVMEQVKGKYPYEEKKSYIYTSSPKENESNITFTSEEPSTLIDRIKKDDDGTIWLVGGGALINDFLQNNLIDEFIISIAPVLIGKGIPLFKNSEMEHDLELTEVRRYGQFAQLYYQIKKS
ncbi:dihydrofolate reductase [Pseudalkalibacillus hwajinpoensis]|uniref:Dihydrofolate reductase n=2 Tax=Guptibacillus hwajinpoensis TaxID=208199 RepID=A0A4U1MLM2_9BACL|nr:dihydrofolate reductase [Pseudalkalibacillus hwajinpoensis]